MSRYVLTASAVLSSLVASSFLSNAQAALVQKDSTNFTHIYDLAGVDNTTALTLGADWIYTEQHWSYTYATGAGGAVSHYGGNNWRHAYSSVANGYTIEARMQVVQPTDARHDIGIYVTPTTSDQSAFLNFNNDNVNWLDLGNGYPGPGAGTDFASTNTDAFHTLRLAFDPASGFSIWRDNVLLTENVFGYGGDTPDPNNNITVYLGAIGGAWQDASNTRVDIDYVRIDTTGGYAPIPEPAALSLIGLGALALRRRK